MKEIIHEGVPGVFFTQKEIQDIQEKVAANNHLIAALMNEVGLNE